MADGVGQVAARVLQPRHQLVAELHQAALLVVTRRHLVECPGLKCWFENKEHKVTSVMSEERR